MTGTRDIPADRLTETLQVPKPGEAVRHRLRRIELEVTGGADAGRRFEVATERAVCGRGEGVDVKLTDSSISAAHFELTLVDGAVLLRDLDSHNGIWVGRGRIDQRIVLIDGAEFQAGRCHFRLHMGEQVADVPLSERSTFGNLCGTSDAARELFAALERVAPWHLAVLVLGETGTGKEEVARAIHAASGRAGPFVVMDCGALAPQLAEGAILGFSKGAFTGATTDHPGCFEEADGGTLLLDEIGELPLELQPKLQRAVDRGEVIRVNETRIRKVDVRVVSATLRDLPTDVANGRFRHDLYQRIAPIVLRVPPLRDRTEDIAVLAQHFLWQMVQEKRIDRMPVVSEDAMVRLRSLSWPGNTRQLKQTIQRAAYLAQHGGITRHEIIAEDNPVPTKALADEVLYTLPLPEALERMRAALETRYCDRLLAETGGDIDAAAERAGYKSRKGFRDLLRRIDRLHLWR